MQRHTYPRTPHENASSAAGQHGAAAPALIAGQLGTGADELTVMLLNTYLIEMARFCDGVFIIPDHRHRAQEIAEWFNTLTTDAVPDVLVLNEIFGESGKDLIWAICSSSWQGNSLFQWGETACDASSHFSVATPITGQRLIDFELFLPSGVVVLLKKGINMLSHSCFVYATQGYGALGRQGIMAVHLTKAGQEYWVLGTHTVGAHWNFDVRLAQLQEMRTFAETRISFGSRVVFVGDMNLYEFPWNDTCLGGEFVDEIPPAKRVLGGGVIEATSGTLAPTGFWLPLQDPVSYSWDVTRNHYGLNVALNRPANNQRYDWVFTPGAGDVFATPADMRYQYVPVKTSTCFCSELNGQGADDLSDHYGVFAQLCYAGSCPSLSPVAGHLGYGGRMPGSAPSCPPASACGAEPRPRSFIAQIVYAVAELLGLVESQITCSGCI